MEKAWSFLETITCRPVRSEPNLPFAHIVPPTDVVLASVFLVETEWDRAFLGTCIPYNTVEPIKERLTGPFPSEFVEADDAWKRRITEHVLGAEADVSVELGTSRISLRQLLLLSKGDVLNLDCGPKDSMVLKVEDVPKGRCLVGRRNGNYAVEVISLDKNGYKEKPLGTKPGRNRQGAGPGESGLDRGVFETGP
jgi:flagellar motor switch protein FliM